MADVWFVTGASRGFGKEIVRAALDAGHSVVATARKVPAADEYGIEGSDRLLVLPLDIIDEVQADNAIAKAVERFGRIDVLVNNAGFGFLGMFEELAPDEIREQFETNVFGTMNVLRAALSVLRQQRAGHILNISSMGGVVGTPGASVYGATKFALECVSEALAREVEPFGIKVTIVEPGRFATDFLDPSSARYGSRRIEDYGAQSEARRKDIRESNHNQPGDPVKFAAALVELAQAEHPPLRFLAGSDAVRVAEQAYKSKLAELDRWRELSLSTDREAVSA